MNTLRTDLEQLAEDLRTAAKHPNGPINGTATADELQAIIDKHYAHLDQILDPDLPMKHGDVDCRICGAHHDEMHDGAAHDAYVADLPISMPMPGPPADVREALVEKVARALASADCGDPEKVTHIGLLYWQNYVDPARHAIDAIEEAS